MGRSALKAVIAKIRPLVGFTLGLKRRVFVLGVHIRTLYVAVLWAALCVGTAWGLPHFANFYHDMDICYFPPIAEALFSMGPFVIALVGYCGAVLIVKKDFFLSARVSAVLNEVVILAVGLGAFLVLEAFFSPFARILQGI